MSASGLVVSQIQDVTIVSFRATSILDASAVETIRHELYALIDEQARRKVVLNFTDVKFLSSTLLGVLLELHNKSTDIAGKILICGLRPELYKVCKVMNFHKLLHFAENEQEAISSFDAFNSP